MHKIYILKFPLWSKLIIPYDILMSSHQITEREREKSMHSERECERKLSLYQLSYDTFLCAERQFLSQHNNN